MFEEYFKQRQQLFEEVYFKLEDDERGGSNPSPSLFEEEIFKPEFDVERHAQELEEFFNEIWSFYALELFANQNINI